MLWLGRMDEMTRHRALSAQKAEDWWTLAVTLTLVQTLPLSGRDASQIMHICGFLRLQLALTSESAGGPWLILR